MAVHNIERESVLTTSQVARLLGINKETVKQWCCEERIHPCETTSGGKEIFRLKDIAHFVATLRTN